MKIKFLMILMYVFFSTINNNIAEPLTPYATLWGWWGNTKGQLGDGTNLLFRERPIQISMANWLIISSGFSYSLAIKADSTLWAWGDNEFGSFGNGTLNSANIPIQVGTEKNWKFVTSGSYASYAIKRDGTLWAWGKNDVGCIGDSTYNDRLFPVQIGKNILGKVRYIWASGKMAAAINEEGSLFTWGKNEFGNLGDGTFENKNHPVKLCNSEDWLTISGNGTYIFAIKTNGTLWAWGYNSHGELMDGSFTNQPTPIQIGSDSDWVDVSCEHTANLAIKKDGTLWAWGTNTNGELGDGSLISKNYPIQIGKDNDWMVARSKRAHSEAIKIDGSFWYWGSIRNFKTLKNDTILIPTQMMNIRNVIQLSRSSGVHSLFLRNYLAKKAKIITLPPENITPNSAEVSGKILSAEGEEIYQRGFCYDFDLDPTISRDTTRNGTNLGEYHTTLTNLLPFTKYYVRAYVTTAAGESYGETERIFTKLATPVLVSPQQSAIDIPLKSDFIWKKDLNAIKYRIQLSEFSNFSSSVFDEEVTDTVFSYSDLELHYDYFWRVQTINGVYFSDWSEVNSFHTIKFNTQQLLSPVEKAINIPIDCQLKWSENTKTCSYILQVSNGVSFNDIILDTILTQNSYAFAKLDYLKSYHWRVRSFIGTDSSNWSPVWMFTTLMDSVKLTSPEDLSSNLSLAQNLSWVKGIYDKKYRLQVAKDNDFSNMIFDTLLNQIYDADIKNLKNYTKYFWRVRNESIDTLGYWSQIWQFKTRMSDVQLIYPENDKTGLAQKIKFIWSAVFGAEFYQLQISKNAQFTDIVYSKDSIKTTEHNVPDLELNSLYHWRVRPWNSESKGTLYWSEVWSFRTGNVGVKDESEYIKIIPNPAGDFITITLKPSEGFELSEGSEIQIYNTLGEKVMTVEQTFLSVQQINISALPKGIYFVKVGGETAKFVKM